MEETKVVKIKHHSVKKEEEIKFDIPTPREIVKELDKYIIGQDEAKKAVAIALRNRARRRLLPKELQEEVAPKNIIMIGPTGVGKTEIARRLSKLAKAPFLKVEATKYTEVGYVGRDVESMIRDLTNIAVNMVKNEMQKEVEEVAEKMVETRIIDLLYPLPETLRNRVKNEEEISDELLKEEPEHIKKMVYARRKMRERLRNGELEDQYVEITVRERPQFPMVDVMGSMNVEDIEAMFPGISNIFPRRKKKRKTTVKEARKILLEEEVEKLIDMDKVIKTAIERVENMGIVFIDEIDKIVTKGSGGSGPEVSREGVQRDLLPIVEGTTVMTRYGVVRTHHILFIAAGAFHNVKPSDLIPELQGRFPIRVELKSLTEEDFVKILKQPKNALITQYQALLKTEGVELEFEEDAIKEIARIAYKVNTETENIGARRLHTIMEKLVEDISFDAPELKGQKVTINAEYVREKLKDIAEDRDLSRYIL